MITIYVKNKEEAEYATKAMDEECLYNCNVGNAEYAVEIDCDKAGSIDCKNELLGAHLMCVVFKDEFEGHE